jgi:acetyl esterase/lipase
LQENRFSILGFGGMRISVSVIRPGKRHEALPGLLYIHGGAFALQASPHHKRLAADYALKTPCTVILVDYRLLPKATYPIGLEDCYAAYKWLIESAHTLGIIPDRIAIGGDSAGGALSIGVCRLALERGLRMPCFQMLIYPVTDARQETPSMRQFTDTPLWNSKLNAKMWQMYLRGVPYEERSGASPAEAALLAGMPPTYVEVSEYDCLRDEGIEFAKALGERGVSTELYETAGTVHGFEIAMNNEIVRESVARRIERLSSAFATGSKK